MPQRSDLSRTGLKNHANSNLRLSWRLVPDRHGRVRPEMYWTTDPRVPARIPGQRVVEPSEAVLV